MPHVLVIFQLLVDHCRLVLVEIFIGHLGQCVLESLPEIIDPALDVLCTPLTLNNHSQSGESDRLSGSTRDLRQNK